MRDKIFGGKQKDSNVVLSGISSALPVGYRDLENQLEQERVKVKALTEQMLALKATRSFSPVSRNSPKRDAGKTVSGMVSEMR